MNEFVGGLIVGIWLGAILAALVIPDPRSMRCEGKGGVHAEGKCYEKREMK
jgi:hypothetical protein